MPPVPTDQLQHSHRIIIAIAFPAILANSSAPLVGLVDTWAIGHLPDAVYLAAIGLGSVIFNFILWIFGFLRMGTTGLIAQAYGQDDTEQLIQVVWRSIALALVLGIILLLLQDIVLQLALSALEPPDSVKGLTTTYFHIRIWSTPAALLIYTISGVLFGLAKTRAVLVQQLVLNVTNAILSLTFVVVLSMGVTGVALGTLIAQWLAAIIGLWILIRIFGIPTLIQGLKSTRTWLLVAFKRLVSINGYIFLRTILLMVAFSLIMRVAGHIGEAEMAASHVVLQYLLLISLGLDGFAHATEALAGSACGKNNAAEFGHWVRMTSLWAIAASLVYAALFWIAGNSITAILTNISAVRESVSMLMPVVILLPVVAVAGYQFDGVFIGATAAAGMLGTMLVAFTVYISVLEPLTAAYGLRGLWGAVLIFMATRGVAQAVWYPRLVKRIERP